MTTAEKPAEGAFVRQPARWRERVDIEPGRYHLFVSLACPWAHRTLIVRRLAGIARESSLAAGHGLFDQGDESDGLYIIVSGSGRMVVDGEEIAVTAGDVIVNRAGGTHALVNPGPSHLDLVVIEAATCEVHGADR